MWATLAWIWDRVEHAVATGDAERIHALLGDLRGAADAEDDRIPSSDQGRLRRQVGMRGLRAGEKGSAQRFGPAGDGAPARSEDALRGGSALPGRRARPGHRLQDRRQEGDPTAGDRGVGGEQGGQVTPRSTPAGPRTIDLRIGQGWARDHRRDRRPGGGEGHSGKPPHGRGHRPTAQQAETKPRRRFHRFTGGQRDAGGLGPRRRDRAVRVPVQSPRPWFHLRGPGDATALPPARRPERLPFRYGASGQHGLRRDHRCAAEPGRCEDRDLRQRPCHLRDCRGDPRHGSGEDGCIHRAHRGTGRPG